MNCAAHPAAASPAFRDLVRHRRESCARSYLPRNRGLRFAANAATASA